MDEVIAEVSGCQLTAQQTLQQAISQNNSRWTGAMIIKQTQCMCNHCSAPLAPCTAAALYAQGDKDPATKGWTCAHCSKVHGGIFASTPFHRCGGCRTDFCSACVEDAQRKDAEQKQRAAEKRAADVAEVAAVAEVAVKAALDCVK